MLAYAAVDAHRPTFDFAFAHLHLFLNHVELLLFARLNRARAVADVVHLILRIRLSFFVEALPAAFAIRLAALVDINRVIAVQDTFGALDVLILIKSNRH